MNKRTVITDEAHDRYNQVGDRTKSAIIPNTSPSLAIHTIKFDDGSSEQFLAYQFDTWTCKHEDNILYGKTLKINKQTRVVNMYCTTCESFGTVLELRDKNDGEHWYESKENWHEMSDYKGVA